MWIIKLSSYRGSLGSLIRGHSVTVFDCSQKGTSVRSHGSF